MSRIYKRNGSWTYVAELGTDPITGKRIRKTKGGFKKKTDCEKAMSKLVASYNGENLSNKLKFKAFTDEWFEMYKSSGNRKESTIYTRDQQVRKIKGYFKEVKLKDVTPIMYQKFLIEMSKEYSDNSLSNLHAVARMIFKKALEIKYIKDDPTQFAELPKEKKTVKDLEEENDIPKYFEKDELKEFLSAVRKMDEEYYIMFYTLAYTGFRAGELCALKWKDVNFEDKEISIYRTLFSKTNKTKNYKVLTPKTETSKRTIKVNENLLKLLKKVRLNQKKQKLKCLSYHNKDFIFTNPKHPGYPENPQKLQNIMRTINDKHSFAKLTPHSLRHTHASLLAEAGVGLQEIMQRLGHKDDRITRNIYLHVTEQKKEEAVQKFTKLMNDF